MGMGLISDGQHGAEGVGGVTEICLSNNPSGSRSRCRQADIAFVNEVLHANVFVRLSFFREGGGASMKF